jgi:hypothetical protein
VSSEVAHNNAERLVAAEEQRDEDCRRELTCGNLRNRSTSEEGQLINANSERMQLSNCIRV